MDLSSLRSRGAPTEAFGTTVSLRSACPGSAYSIVRVIARARYKVRSPRSEDERGGLLCARACARARARSRAPAGPGFSVSIPTLVHVNIRPSPHAGPLLGSGRHPAGRLGRLCMLICPGLPCVFQNWADTHTHTHTQTKKTLSIFPPALAPARPGLPCIYLQHH